MPPVVSQTSGIDRRSRCKGRGQSTGLSIERVFSGWPASMAWLAAVSIIVMPSVRWLYVVGEARWVMSSVDQTIWQSVFSTPIWIIHIVNSINQLEDSPSPSMDFVGKITSFYSELAESQQPLGREFEEIWDANAAYLYESWLATWGLGCFWLTLTRRLLFSEFQFQTLVTFHWNISETWQLG